MEYLSLIHIYVHTQETYVNMCISILYKHIHMHTTSPPTTSGVSMTGKWHTL